MRVESLVFDAYGTLFDVHSVQERCERLWPGQGAAVSQAWRAKQLEYTWLRSLMGRYEPFSTVTRDALSHACAAMNLDLPAAHLEGLMSEYLRLALYPDVRDSLEVLSSKKMAVLSNGSPDMLLPLVEGSGLRFDAVLSVDELKVFKPAPQVYALAVRRLGGAKERIGFVSSNCWDALGAKAFGLRVFWINRGGAPVDRLGFQPDAVLRTLGDLPEVLR